MRFTNFLTYLPLLLIAILVAIQIPSIIISSYFAPVFFEKVTEAAGGQLVGQQAIDLILKDETKILSQQKLLENFTTKTYQASFEKIVQAKNPFKVSAIRLHNQLYYSIFKKSYAENGMVIIGKENIPFALKFLAGCHVKNDKLLKESVKTWYENLIKIHAFFKERDQTFVYLITPSKGSYFSEYLPANLPCISVRPFYLEAKKYLDKGAVPYFDASAYMLSLKDKYHDLLFPRQGIHWTRLSAAMTANGLLDSIEKSSEIFIPNILYKYSFTEHINSDIDTVALINILGKPKYPMIDIEVNKAATGKAVTLAMVSGSFADQLLDVFHKANVFFEINYYYYFSQAQRTFLKTGEITTVYPDKPETGTMKYSPLYSSDIIILEENEIAMNHNINFLIDKIKNDFPESFNTQGQ
ncbi:MAG: hypothetical protein ACHQAX_07440 [Gammaproteobacteria bacterium]